MELIEVIELLKEMVTDCTDLNGDDFLIAPSKLPGSIVEGYEIHFSGQFNDATRKYINDVALKRKLAVTQHPDSIMLYQAKQPLHQKATQPNT